MCNGWKGILQTLQAAKGKELIEDLLNGITWGINKDVTRNNINTRHQGEALEPLTLDKAQKSLNELKNSTVVWKDNNPVVFMKRRSE